MEPREALDGLISERGETYASISRLLGRNSAYIQQFIKRGSPARLDQSDIALLALHFDVPVEMLGGKEGPTVGQRSIVKVPLLNGTGNDSRSQWRLVDAAWLGRLCDQPASVAILSIVGEAMEPTLCNGDEVMISRVRFQESVREGLYAIRGSSEIFVRRIAIDPTKNRLTVLTDHPAYPSWQGIQRKGVDIVGRVIWIGARVT
ncbi:helix-turn-helix transcriptional regulator [Sphingobium xenophagum]|uniref:S24 family peptidase n=1 Tax=Sphingobium xenophagum TaxID=121428 RepID=UPI0036D3F810|tara:strand:- start:630 stop:1241 length:612 start_codon:yes stop_codon:yes gene_type:complete